MDNQDAKEPRVVEDEVVPENARLLSIDGSNQDEIGQPDSLDRIEEQPQISRSETSPSGDETQKIDGKANHENQVVGEERISWKLRSLPWIIFFIILELGIILSIITLYALSTRNNGFVSIDDSPLTSGSLKSKLLNDKPFLWTSLPVLFLNLFQIG
jgi:hypothetical protein